MGIQVFGQTDQVLRNEVVRGGRHGIQIHNSKRITVTSSQFRDHEGTAVEIIGSEDVTLEMCSVDGSGISPAEWALHGIDCINVQNSRNVRIVGCPVIARGAHAGIVMLETSGVIELLDNTIERMNGSGFTFKRDTNRVKALRNRISGCPYLAQAPSVHRVPHAAVQVSGFGHEFGWNIFDRNGKGILGSASGQVLHDCLFHDNFYLNCEVTGIELQGVDGADAMFNLEFLRETYWNARQLVHYAMAGGMPSNLANIRWIDCSFGQGAFFVTGRSVASAEALNSLTGSRGNKTIHTAPAIPAPGDPPPPPPPPPPTDGTTPGTPRLVSINPTTGKAGTLVTCTVQESGPGGYVMWEVPVTSLTPEGLRRTAPISWSATKVVAKAPSDVISGRIFIRRSDTGKASNALRFDVGAAPPPPAEPPPPPPPPPPPDTTPAPVAVDSPRIDAAPRSVVRGQELTLLGRSFEAAKGFVTVGGVSHPAEAVTVWKAAEVRVKVLPLVPIGNVTVNLRRAADQLHSNDVLVQITAAPVPPPSPSPDPVTDVWQARGTPEEQEMLLASLRRIQFPWRAMLPAMQRAGIPRILCEFADLSALEQQLTTKKGRRAGPERRMTLFSAGDDDHHHEHATWLDQVPGLPEETRRFIAGTASYGRIRVEQRLKGDPRTVDVVVSAEAAHECMEWFYATDAMRDQLLPLLYGGPPQHTWWWGDYSANYWEQPGEAIMAGWGFSYSDTIAEDPRFRPYFKRSQAAEIRRILGLERTG